MVRDADNTQGVDDPQDARSPLDSALDDRIKGFDADAQGPGAGASEFGAGVDGPVDAGASWPGAGVGRDDADGTPEHVHGGGADWVPEADGQAPNVDDHAPGADAQTRGEGRVNDYGDGPAPAEPAAEVTNAQSVAGAWLAHGQAAGDQTGEGEAADASDAGFGAANDAGAVAHAAAGSDRASGGEPPLGGEVRSGVGHVPGAEHPVTDAPGPEQPTGFEQHVGFQQHAGSQVHPGSEQHDGVVPASDSGRPADAWDADATLVGEPALADAPAAAAGPVTPPAGQAEPGEWPRPRQAPASGDMNGQAGAREDSSVPGEQAPAGQADLWPQAPGAVQADEKEIGSSGQGGPGQRVDPALASGHAEADAEGAIEHGIETPAEAGHGKELAAGESLAVGEVPAVGEVSAAGEMRASSEESLAPSDGGPAPSGATFAPGGEVPAPGSDWLVDGEMPAVGEVPAAGSSPQGPAVQAPVADDGPSAYAVPVVDASSQPGAGNMAAGEAQVNTNETGEAPAYEPAGSSAARTSQYDPEDAVHAAQGGAEVHAPSEQWLAEGPDRVEAGPEEGREHEVAAAQGVEAGAPAASDGGLDLDRNDTAADSAPAASDAGAGAVDAPTPREAQAAFDAPAEATLNEPGLAPGAAGAPGLAGPGAAAIAAGAAQGDETSYSSVGGFDELAEPAPTAAAGSFSDPDASDGQGLDAAASSAGPAAATAAGFGAAAAWHIAGAPESDSGTPASEYADREGGRGAFEGGPVDPEGRREDTRFREDSGTGADDAQVAPGTAHSPEPPALPESSTEPEHPALPASEPSPEGGSDNLEGASPEGTSDNPESASDDPATSPGDAVSDTVSDDFGIPMYAPNGEREPAWLFEALMAEASKPHSSHDSGEAEHGGDDAHSNGDAHPDGQEASADEAGLGAAEAGHARDAAPQQAPSEPGAQAPEYQAPHQTAAYHVPEHEPGAYATAWPAPGEPGPADPADHDAPEAAFAAAAPTATAALPAAGLAASADAPAGESAAHPAGDADPFAAVGQPADASQGTGTSQYADPFAAVGQPAEASQPADAGRLASASSPAASQSAAGIPGDIDSSRSATLRKKRRRRWPFLLAACLLIAVAYVCAAFYFTSKIPAQASVAGVDIGGMSRGQATQKLQDELSPRVANPMTVKVGSQTTQINPSDFSAAFDAEATIDSVSGFSLNPVRVWNSISGTGEVTPVVNVDEDKLANTVKALTEQTISPPVNASITFEGAKAVTTPASSGETVDSTAALMAMRTGAVSQGDVVIPVTQEDPEITDEEAANALDEYAEPLVAGNLTVTVDSTPVEITPEQLASVARFTAEDGQLKMSLDPTALGDLVRAGAPSVLKEGKDAKIEIVNHQTPKITPSEDGVGIDDEKLAEEALKAVRSSDRSVEIETQPITAEFTTEDAEKMGIKEVVAEIETPLTDDEVRTTNLRIGTGKVTNTLVKPGDRFSLLDTLGPITEENGFVSSGVVANGFNSTATGGGLSQLSTNMYNLGFLAGYEDIEHKPHSKYFERYPMGREATLWEGQIDMIWENNTPYGAVIDTWVADGKVYSRLWSTKYWKVETKTSDPYNKVAPTTKTNPSADCEPSAAGGSGFTVDIWRKVSRDGEVHEDKTTSWTYSPVDAVVCN